MFMQLTVLISSYYRLNAIIYAKHEFYHQKEKNFVLSRKFCNSNLIANIFVCRNKFVIIPNTSVSNCVIHVKVLKYISVMSFQYNKKLNMSKFSAVCNLK